MTRRNCHTCVWDGVEDLGPGEWDIRRRIEAEFAKMGATRIPTRPDTGGWRGHEPICRGPGGTVARRLRRLVRGRR